MADTLAQEDLKKSRAENLKWLSKNSPEAGGKSTPEYRRRREFEETLKWVEKNDPTRKPPQPEPMKIPKPAAYGSRPRRSYRSGTKAEQAATMIGAAELATVPVGLGVKGLATGFKGGMGLLKKEVLKKSKKKGTTRLDPKVEKEAFNKIGAQRSGAKTKRDPLPTKKKVQEEVPVGDGPEAVKIRRAQLAQRAQAGDTRAQLAQRAQRAQQAKKEFDALQPTTTSKKVGSRGSKVTTDPKTGVTTMRDASGKVIAKKVPAGKRPAIGEAFTKTKPTPKTAPKKDPVKLVEEAWKTGTKKGEAAAKATRPAPKKSNIGEAFTKPTKPAAKKVPAGKRPAIGEAFTKPTKPAAKKVTKIPRHETAKESLRQTQKINRDAVIKKALEEAERVGLGTGPRGKLTASEVLKVSRKALRSLK